MVDLMKKIHTQNRTKGGHLLTTSRSILERQPCEKDDQCGPWAECVVVTQKGPKRCWCVNNLESPDPETGGCPSMGSGHPHDRSRNGVLLQHHLQDIVLSGDGNATAGGSVNESSSMLQLPTVESSVSMPWSQVILPAMGSFVCVSILILVTVIYRRRFTFKKYCTGRQPDVFSRHNDGVILLDRMNHIKSNPTYFCQNSALSRRHNAPEVSCEHLKLEDVVGEGAFGQVFRGNLLNPENNTHRQVAVKVLRDGTTPEKVVQYGCSDEGSIKVILWPAASTTEGLVELHICEEAREDFEREVEIMSAFDHDNILKLLGIVVQGMDGNPYMIFEYMEHGDLSELLRKNDPLMRCLPRKTIALSKADLVDMCVQIANGMCYLAAQRFVHRDLATRNCLVGNGLVVKISDFGMSRDIYISDYYKVGGSRMLPVRWMSPEAIKYGRFTCESDIWAYGVVLWEVFSYGKQPYCGHTNDEVIHFLDQGILLQRPEDCPSTVYHVMLACWKKDPRERIAFERLSKYLRDFRDRLVKPAQPPQQHCTDAAINGAKLQNSDINVYVVGLPEKGASIADAIQNKYTQQVSRSTTVGNSTDVLNYICIGDFANAGSDLSIPSLGQENPSAVATICEANCKSAIIAKSCCDMNSKTSDTSGGLDFGGKQQTQLIDTNDSVPTRNVASAVETCFQDVLNLHQQPELKSKKAPARKTYSCPLSLQKEKLLGQQTDTGLYRNNDILNKQITSCDPANLSPQQFSTPTSQRNKFNSSSSSNPDISLSLTSLSEASSMLTCNAHDVQGNCQGTDNRQS